jgi:hypothetical protein
MRTYVAVPGTWGWRDKGKPDAWFQPTSEFAKAMARAGIVPLRERPFLWTTRINGTEWWRRWFSWIVPKGFETGDMLDWEAAAEALRWYCEAEGTPDVVIAHSHAGQVATMAAADGLKIPLLITVCTPVRADLSVVYERARANVGTWRHLYAEGGDPIQWWGSFGDGEVAATRLMRWAHENHGVPGTDHSRLLNDPRLIREWTECGWLGETQ